MKWFKHDTSAIKDEKIQFIIEKCGAEGYMLYFGLCELVGEKIDGNLDPTGRFRWRFLRDMFHVSRTTIERFLHECHTIMEFSFNCSDEFLEIKIPNLLKRLDEYTEKSRHGRDLIGHKNKKKEEEQEERKREREKALTPLVADRGEVLQADPDFNTPDSFNAFWAQYPSKGRLKQSAALQIFNETVVSRGVYSRLLKSLGNYLEHLKANTWKQPMAAGRWLEEWPDWEHHVEEKELEDWQKKAIEERSRNAGRT